MMKLIEVLAEFYEDTEEWNGERVAEAFHERGLDPADYYWAEVHYCNGDYWIIFWSKSYCQVLRNIDIFDIDDGDKKDLEIYLTGLSGNHFSPDKAAQVMLTSEEIEHYELEDTLQEMKSMAEHLTVNGEYWFDEVVGREIPYRIVKEQVAKLEERVEVS